MATHRIELDETFALGRRTAWAAHFVQAPDRDVNALEWRHDADPIRFLAYLMTYGTLAEIAVVRRYLDLDDFREALEHAPPGIIDERSWAYWNAMTGRYPVPPMPRRTIPDGT